jgi:protein-S-isoprenylcysteine O-methyltransferase Ste14
MPYERILATVLGLAIALVSGYFYDHKDQKYATGKSIKIDSPRSFSAVYQFIRFSSLLICLPAFLIEHFLLLQFHHNIVLLFTGLAVAFIGLAIFIAGKVNLGDNYSPCFDSYLPTNLTQVGIYRYIRHPIYIGNIFVIAGLFVASGSFWMLLNVLMLTYYYVRSARVEEAKLANHFSAYRDYQSKTGMFFPPVLGLTGSWRKHETD